MTASTHHGHQPGPHPDVELLSAFAERALSAHERNQVLAHLAGCVRCRQIIALAGRAHEEAESHTLVAAVAAAPVVAVRRPPNPWWTKWRLIWIPAAFALAFAVTWVSFNLHRTKPGGITIQIATQATPSADPDGAPSASKHENAIHPKLSQNRIAPPASVPPTPAKQKNPAPQPSAKAQPVPRTEFATAAPPTLHTAFFGASTPPRTLPPGLPPAPSPPPPQSATETVTVASDRPAPETVTAQQFIPIQPPGAADNSPLRATPPPPAALPPSQQVQEEREKKFAEFDRQVQTAENSDQLSAARAAPQSASVSAATSGSNTSGAVYTQPAASHPGSIATFSSVHGLASYGSTASIPLRLPSGFAIASIASSGHLLLAIDKSGALFVTHNSGVTWRRVARQWTGNAVLVRTRNLAAPGANESPTAQIPSDSSAGSSAASVLSTVFEVVNEDNQVWQSADGLVWVAK
jgi:hypothetical protein